MREEGFGDIFISKDGKLNIILMLKIFYIILIYSPFFGIKKVSIFENLFIDRNLPY